MKVKTLTLVVTFTLSVLMLASCEKEKIEPQIQSEQQPSFKTETEDEPECAITLSNITPVDKCENADEKWGVQFEVDNQSFINFYQNGLGLIVDVREKSSGNNVLHNVDWYCMNNNNTPTRTTIINFSQNCSAIGPSFTLAKNTTYEIRVYTIDALCLSPWYQFTTLNTSPCAE